MQFNSYAFILAFLPLTAAGYFLLCGSRLAAFSQLWMLLASLLFYSVWSPVYLPLMLASIGFNFLLGRGISARAGQSAARALLIAGIITYTVFLVNEIRRNEEHDSFINAVTHELKTPIASIRLYLETLLSRELSDDQRREFYRVMLADTDRLHYTVDQVLKAGVARAVVVNSGNANACTGRQGMADAREMARLAAAQLGVAEREVFVGSTGRIGVNMPMENVRSGIVAAAATNDGRVNVVTATVGQALAGFLRGLGNVRAHPNARRCVLEEAVGMGLEALIGRRLGDVIEDAGA